MLKVLLDTNILISAMFFGNAKINKLITRIIDNGQIILTDYSINELYRVAQNKFSAEKADIEVFLNSFPYIAIKTPDSFGNIPKMRDEKDTPILAAALEFGCNIIVSGDKDFLSLEIENPKIMSITDFIETYQ